MKNEIKYFYNLEPQTIINKKNYYFFIIDDCHYYLKIYNRNIEDINYLQQLNKNMLNTIILSHEIILNKDKSLISLINNIPYYLFKTCINEKALIKLSDISYLSNKKINYDSKLIKNTWPELWSKKIDYLERQVNEMGKKYPLLVESFNYFVGLAENAISYATETINNVPKTVYDNSVITHIRIKKEDTLLEFYDTINLTIDHKARDVAEYIKTSFFKKNKYIFQELNEYFKHNIYSEYGIRMLLARLIYPSFYFDLYEDIISGIQKETTILTIISEINNYEIYLKQIFLYFKMFYNIPSIEWIIKKG